MSEILEKPFEQLSIEELKSGIQSKFGSITRLCLLTNRDVYEVNKLFKLKRTPENDALLRSLYNDAKTSVDKPIGNDLDEKVRREIKTAIYQKSDNILDFSTKYSISNTWLSTVINGKIKKITPKVKELLKVLDIDIKQIRLNQ